MERYLARLGVSRLELVVASSLGADLATAFLARGTVPVAHAFFDGGQFAQIGRGTRRLMTPVLYLAIKSLGWSRGATLKHILWCDDDAIKPYFVQAARGLGYGNLRRMMADSLQDRPLPELPVDLQRRSFWEFGSAEEHLKYRPAVMAAWPQGNFPVFEGLNHMQFQIRDPKGFADMLRTVVEKNELPELPFLSQAQA